MWWEQEQGVEVEVRLGPDALGRRLRWFGNQPHRRLSSRHTCSPGAPCIENGRNMITVVEGEQDKLVGELRRWQAKVRRRPYLDNIDWQISAQCPHCTATTHAARAQQPRLKRWKVHVGPNLSPPS